METTVATRYRQVNFDTASLIIRQPNPEDLPALIDIEDKAHHYPWPDATLHWALNQKAGFTRIMEAHGRVIGFAIFECVLDEASLLNIAIDPDSQHRGLGRRLLTECIAALGNPIHKILLEVRASNRNARQLYQSLGFTEIAIRKDYYPTFTGREDAHVMVFFKQEQQTPPA